MNIMIFADQESKLLYEYYDPEQMKDIDLIISCGDLEPEYLTFFATLCHAPLLYVKGNHDTNMNTNRRKAAFVLMMIFLYTRESVFWDWEVPWNIYRTHLISTQRR